MAVSREIQLLRKREAEKKRRQRIQDDPSRRIEVNRKRREREARKKIADSKKRKSKKQIQAQRKKWRLAKQRYIAKKKEKCAQSSKEPQNVIPTRCSSMKRAAKLRAEKKRLQIRYLFSKLYSKNVHLKKKALKYAVRYYRLKNEISIKSNSPRSALHRSLHRKTTPTVRRRLLFTDSILTDIKESFSKIRSKNDQRTISKHISFKYVKKYRMLNDAKPYFTFNSFECFSKKKRLFGEKRRQMSLVKKSVSAFFQDDDVSVISPSKSDQIVKKKLKKQKRFLTNSMTYLYKKFCEKNSFFIGYSTFCKLRPFWVVNRPCDRRDTCLCVKCENAKLMCQQMRRLEIVNCNNIDSLIDKEMLCEPITEACRFRRCETCVDKVIEIKEFDGDAECFYESWDSVNESGKDGKMYRHTKKIRKDCTKLQLVSQFMDDVLPNYVKHRGIDYHQKNEMKKLKKNLSEKDIVLHIDFAENYACKYGREIQTVHFGGNRDQITLHTGVVYHGSETDSFCTVSKDLNHNPVAIYHHLKPIIERFQNENIENVHFLSDSPATQYRNQFMFYIILKKIVPMFKNLKNLTWNFSESGHGKGAPDGIGATLKRTCDRIISYSMRDISNFEQFLECVTQQIVKIRIINVHTEDAKLSKEIKLSSKPVKGTMKVHQVSYSKNDPNVLRFNTLSCFECKDECIHYKMIGKIDYGEVKSSVDLNKKNISTRNDLVSSEEPSTSNCKPANGIESTNAPQSVDVSTISEGDWAVVRFKMQEIRSHERRWIGKITRVNENDTYLMNFVRNKRTRQHPGFIYSYPQEPDDYTVYKTQILYKIEAPTVYQRALKFGVHTSELITVYPSKKKK